MGKVALLCCYGLSLILVLTSGCVVGPEETGKWIVRPLYADSIVAVTDTVVFGQPVAFTVRYVKPDPCYRVFNMNGSAEGSIVDIEVLAKKCSSDMCVAMICPVEISGEYRPLARGEYTFRFRSPPGKTLDTLVVIK